MAAGNMDGVAAMLSPDVVWHQPGQGPLSGDLVSATVRFSATRPGRAPLNQCGVDVFRVKDGRIAQVWLISEDIDAEDAFWI